MNIGVYVTSRYKNVNEFTEYMDGCIKKFLPVGKPTALVTGDYKSTNSGNGLVARYAFEHNIPLRRFATMWGKHNPTKAGKKNNAGVASNAQIVKNSNGCILFWTPTSVAKWDFMSGGCRSFLRMCDEGHMARPLIKIKVDIYAPDKEIPIEEPSQWEPMGGIGGTDGPGLGGGVNGVGMELGGLGSGGSSAPHVAPHAVGLSAPLPIGGGGGSSASPIDIGGGSPSNGEENGGIPQGEDDTDNLGNIDSEMASVPSTAGSIISQMPVDSNGDGTPDSTITAVDTDMNGSPDAVFTPVDTDNNGTIDKLELTPMPTAGQIVSAQNAQQQQVQPMSQQEPAPTSVPANTTAPQQPTTTQPSQPTEDEIKKQQSPQ